MEMGKQLDSDGNRVNVGSFDAKGLNVNNNWDDNRSDGLGLASSRQSFLYLEETRSCESLSFFSRANPTAEHTANLVNMSLKNKILLVVNSPHIFREAYENAEHIQLHAC
ncbi:MAG: hypothetical protein PHV99_02360 [Candidatus Pacebacteria bacterium]|nr:hypothetical protein [Candidatus Paceibacterota bacterium]